MNQQKPVIIILGPQGSGKGTQGKKLAAKLGLPYLETGQLLRDEIASGSDHGKYLGSIVDKGQLLSDDDINNFMKDKVRFAANNGQGFILDGYPRRHGQAEFVDSIIKPTHVLLIDIPDEESVSRLSARRQCPKDKRIYNLITAPPKQDEVCDDCGTKLEQRVDDTPVAIQKRLNLYHTDTEPVLAWYKEQGVLHRIDGTHSIDEVEKKVWEVFNNFSL